MILLDKLHRRHAAQRRYLVVPYESFLARIQRIVGWQDRPGYLEGLLHRFFLSRYLGNKICITHVAVSGNGRVSSVLVGLPLSEPALELFFVFTRPLPVSFI